MDPNLAALLGVIFGGLGLIAGAIAIVYAHKANKLSKTSNQTASESKDLAVEANSLASESNTIAADARQLAQEANTYSHRAETRETERHDVRWTGEWIALGRYCITKHGDDEALQVTVTVTVDGEEGVAKVDSVVDQHREVTLRFPRAAMKQRDHQVDVERGRRPQIRGFNSAVGGAAPAMRMHGIVEHIQWTTPGGRPETHNLEKRIVVPRDLPDA